MFPVMKKLQEEFKTVLVKTILCFSFSCGALFYIDNGKIYVGLILAAVAGICLSKNIKFSGKSNREIFEILFINITFCLFFGLITFIFVHYEAYYWSLICIAIAGYGLGGNIRK